MSQKVILTNGRLGKDAEVATSGNGVKYVTFSLACGNRRDDSTTWYECVGFDDRFTNDKFTQYLKKGSAVNVMGELTASAQLGKDGDKAYLNLKVVLMDIEFAGTKRDDENGSTVSSTTTTTQAPKQATPVENVPTNIPEDVEEDLPF